MELVAAVLAFPERGPYRIDQVRSDPAGLLLLFAVEVALAWLIDWASRRDFLVPLRVATGLLVLMVGFFFMLGSWGLGDVTRLSYLLVENPYSSFGLREPFWTLLAPAIRFLPYRFSFVHGCVAACYAAATIWLAHRQRSPAWSGWWALMVVHSPLLRNFLQSGVTRQALAAILLMPLMLWCAGGPRLSVLRTVAFTTFSALCHSSYLLSLVVAISPLVVTGQIWLQRVGFWLKKLRHQSWQAFLIGAMSILALAVWIVLNADGYLAKLDSYLWEQDYYPSFLLRIEANKFLFALVVSVLIVCFLKRIGFRQCVKSPVFLSMVLFLAILIFFRFSIENQWLPQLTSRFQDAVGLYLLMLFLVWVSNIGVRYITILPIAVTTQYWLFGRLAISGVLPCGRNDEFLCTPDRLPWDVVYWN